MLYIWVEKGIIPSLVSIEKIDMRLTIRKILYNANIIEVHLELRQVIIEVHYLDLDARLSSF